MKLPYRILSMATVAMVAGFTVPSFGAGATDDTITLAQVPATVKNTLKKYAADSEVKKIEKGDQDGTAVFEFDIEQGAKKFELTITPNGDFLGTEEEIALTDMPAAAQKTLKAKSKGGKIITCEKAVDAKQKITYEAVIEKKGKKVEVAVDAKGKVVSTEAVTEGKD